MRLRSQKWMVQVWTISLGLVLLLGAEITIAQVTITEVTTPSLGSLLAGASGRDFVLNTDDTVSGADAADYLFGAQSGQVDISKSGSPQNATIVANNFSTTGGITINGVPCKWRNETPTTCHGSGITKQIRSQARPLKLGVDIDTSQAHSGGDSATATYDIDVTLI